LKVKSDLTMSLDLCIEQLSNLSSKQLYQLEAKIQEEFKIRANKRYRDTLEEWVRGAEGTPRAVKYMVAPSTHGWIAIIGVFQGNNNEMFKVIHKDKDQAKELVAKHAIDNSGIIDLTEPMSID